MKGRTEAFTEDKLEKLAADPGNVVYKYDYDKPDAKLSPAVQISMYRDIVLKFDESCIEFPRASNEALRETVLGLNTELRLFQHLYPKVFAMSTLRARTDEEVTRLDKTRKVVMLGLVERYKAGDDEEACKARTLEQAVKLCIREATAEELASSSATRADPKDLPAGLKALDPSALGSCTVNQRRV